MNSKAQPYVGDMNPFPTHLPGGFEQISSDPVYCTQDCVCVDIFNFRYIISAEDEKKRIFKTMVVPVNVYYRRSVE